MVVHLQGWIAYKVQTTTDSLSIDHLSVRVIANIFGLHNLCYLLELVRF